MRYLIIFALLSTSVLQGQGIEFFKGSLEQAKAKATKEGKLIFVDAYTTWCGPCKRMSKNVFPQAMVGDYFNAQFINMKIDMEKGEGRDFQRNYQVRAFPTLLFLDGDGNVVHKKIGGTNPQGLVALGQEAAIKGDPTAKLTTQYNNGERDAEFMADYIFALSKNDRPRLKIVNEYLKEQTDLDPALRQSIIFYGAERADSKVFDELVANKNLYNNTFGAEAVETCIKNACSNTVSAAIEFESEDLLLYANEKAEMYLTQSEDFMLDNRIRYFSAFPDEKMAKKLVKDAMSSKLETKETLAYALLQDKNTEEGLLKKIHKSIMGDSMAGKRIDACFICAQLQERLGNSTEALQFAQKALALAEESNSPSQKAISSFVQDLTK